MMTPEEQAYVRKLEETIVKLEARIAELERRLNMNSSNSSKPPSTDKPNQKKRSLRKPSKCYGPKIQALAIGMNTYCAVSVNKIHEFFMSVLKLPVSTGFIHNAVKKYTGKLDDAISSIKKAHGLFLYCGNCKVL